jgi:outer membrane protein assembly factor BamB
MTLKRLMGVVACSTFLTSAICVGQGWQEFGYYGWGSLSCRERAALVSFEHKGTQKGVALMSLSSGTAQWEAIPKEATMLRPVVAGNAVAILTHQLHTINAFALSTGQPLWQKEDDTQILESDGRYFYVHGNSDTILEALDPQSGKVVWSRRIPYSGYLIYSYHVHDGRLYTAEFVFDLSRRMVVHRWPATPLVNAIAFDRRGRIYAGDPSGVVRVYSSSFRLLRTIHAGRGEIVELGAAKNGLIATSYERNRGYDSVFKVLTRQGRTKWQLAWRSQDRLGAVQFRIAGPEVLLIEPDIAAKKYWLTSRNLSTGRMNWKTNGGTFDRPLAGPIAICGDTVYANDQEAIHGFDLHTGKETSVAVLSADPR